MALLRRAVASFLFAAVAATSFSQTPTAFMRMQKPSATKEDLQTLAREYTPAHGKGPVVWLVGVAHIGEEGYYKELQKLLDAQQVVLYEGVTRNGVDPAKAGDDKLAKSTYKALSDALKLQFQLFGIDYDHPSFHNADLSWDELQAIQKKYPPAKGGMSLSTIGSMLNADSSQGQMIVNALAAIKDDPSSIEAMHIGMIELLSDPTVIERTLSPSLNEVLIRSRNAKVLDALKKQLASNPNSVAIFFGAGHMANMEQHLIKDFGYKPGAEKWYTAIEGDNSKVTSPTGQMLLQSMRSMAKQKKIGG